MTFARSSRVLPTSLLATHLALATVVVHGPAGTRWVGSKPAVSPSCVREVSPHDWEFACAFSGSLQLTFSRDGFEPREVAVSPASVVDLDDGRWLPTPLPVVLKPVERSAGARLYWLDEDELHVALPDDEGRVAGPRIPPGSRFRIVVAGDAIAGVLLDGVREGGEAVPVITLGAGASAVALCREPWAGSLVRACRLQVGRPSPLLRRHGLARLVPTAEVAGGEGLWVVSGELSDTAIQAEAPDLPTLVQPLSPADGVVEVVFPFPRTVAVELYDPDEGRGVEGRVRLVRMREDIVIVEAATDHRGAAELTLAAGTYRLLAEAPGYRPQELELQVDKPRTHARVPLERGARLGGRVVDEAGQPVAGATVVAAEGAAGAGAWRLESPQNLAATGADGTFELTAPGRGPWQVWAYGEGFSSEGVAVADAETRIVVRVARWCSLRVVPVDPHGTPRVVSYLVFLRPSTFAVRMAHEQGEDGAFPVELAPGRWEVLAEAEELQGRLEVPAACAGARLSVLLTGAPAR